MKRTNVADSLFFVVFVTTDSDSLGLFLFGSTASVDTFYFYFSAITVGRVSSNSALNASFETKQSERCTGIT